MYQNVSINGITRNLNKLDFVFNPTYFINNNILVYSSAQDLVMREVQNLTSEYTPESAHSVRSVIRVCYCMLISLTKRSYDVKQSGPNSHFPSTYI